MHQSCLLINVYNKNVWSLKKKFSLLFVFLPYIIHYLNNIQITWCQMLNKLTETNACIMSYYPQTAWLLTTAHKSHRQTEMFDYMTQKDVWRNINII